MEFGMGHVLLILAALFVGGMIRAAYPGPWTAIGV